jgi:hypothetical protein
LNLDPAVGLDGLGGQRAVGFKCIATMLPQDDCFDAVGSRTCLRFKIRLYHQEDTERWMDIPLETNRY